MRIGPFIAIGLLLAGIHAVADEPTNGVSVCRFPDGKRAVVSFTFDDGPKVHVTDLAPRLDRYGFKATFYVIAGQVPAEPQEGPKARASWPELKAVAATGHEIGNHGMTHLNLQSVTNTVALQCEILDAADLIAAKVGRSPVSYAYPFCKSNPAAKAVVRSRHAVDRGYFPLYEGQYPIEKANAEADQAVADGTWLVRLSHGIDGAAFEEHLKYLKSRESEIGVGTYGDIGRYVAERDAVQLTVRERRSDHVTFSVTLPATMKADLFCVPLAVRVERAPGQAPVIVPVVPDGKPVIVRW